MSFISDGGDTGHNSYALDPRGRVTHLAWESDAFGGGSEVTTRYDRRGDIARDIYPPPIEGMPLPSGTTRYRVSRESGRAHVVGVLHGETQVDREFSFDEEGRVTFVRDVHESRETSCAYDERGRLVTRRTNRTTSGQPRPELEAHSIYEEERLVALTTRYSATEEDTRELWQLDEGRTLITSPNERVRYGGRCLEIFLGLCSAVQAPPPTRGARPHEHPEVILGRDPIALLRAAGRPVPGDDGFASEVEDPFLAAYDEDESSL